MTKFLGYGHQSVDEADIAAVAAALRGDYLTQGPAIERFESALAERVGARHAVAVSSGTAALHLAVLAARLAPGSRGATSTLTFVASANCMLYCGMDADPLDIDPDTLCLSPTALADYLGRTGERARLVIPVAFAGLAGASAEIRAAAGGRLIVEDACHALGGAYANGQPVGCGDFADMTVFSFHPVKPITTGEGGAVVTNDDELARRLKMLRSHGIERDPFRMEAPLFEDGRPAPWYYEQQSLGFNYRMTDIQAVLGLSQLDRLDTFLARRRAIAAFYDAEFAGLPHLRLPQSNPEMRRRSGMHLYLIHADWKAIGTTRTAAMERLKAQGIGTQVHYVPVHRQPFHRLRLTGGPEDFPAAEAYYAGCLSLPLFPAMTDEDARRVVDAVRAVWRG